MDTKLSGFGGWFHLKFHVKKKKAILWDQVNETKPLRQ
jgi:hypothetical protein